MVPPYISNFLDSKSLSSTYVCVGGGWLWGGVREGVSVTICGWVGGCFSALPFVSLPAPLCAVHFTTVSSLSDEILILQEGIEGYVQT